MPDSPVRRRSLFSRSRSPPKALGRRLSYSDEPVHNYIDQQMPQPANIFAFQPSLYLHPPEQYQTSAPPLQPRKQPPEDLQHQSRQPVRPPPPLRLEQSPPESPIPEYHMFLSDQAHHAQQARQTHFSPHHACTTTPHPLAECHHPNPNQQKSYLREPPTPPTPPPTIEDIRTLKYEIWTEVTRTWDPFYNHNAFPKHILSVEEPLKNDEQRMRAVWEQMNRVKREVDVLRELVKGDAESPQVGYGEGVDLHEQWI